MGVTNLALAEAGRNTSTAVIMVDVDNTYNIPELQKRMLTNLVHDYNILKIYKLNQTVDDILTSGALPRRCRFCGKAEPEVSFNKRAHVISELCGSHHLLSDYECDSCNNKFSKFERQFSQFMLFYHSILGVEGKKGVPEYQRDRNGTTGITNVAGIPNIRTQVNEAPIFKIRKKDGKLLVTGTRTYVPVDVYRALLKMALTVMPDSEMQYLQDALEFLCDESVSIKESKQVALRVYTGGMNVIRPASVQLYKRKADSTSKVPAYLFALSYSNFTFQMYLPGCSLDSHLSGETKLDLPVIPTVADGIFPFETEVLDFNNIQKVVKEPVPISLAFEKIEGRWLVTWWKRMGYYAEQLWYWLKRKVKYERS